MHERAMRAAPRGRGPCSSAGAGAPRMLNRRLLTHGLACTALICLADVCLFGALVGRAVSERAAWGVACWTAEWFWGYMQHHFEHTCNALPVLRVSGDPIPPGESALLISNHQTYADYYLVQHLAARAGMLGSCRYFAKKELVWQVPIFGWAFWAIGMILVSRNWTNDAALVEQAFGRIRKNEHPVWIVLYPEGTRRTPKKVVQGQAFARQHGEVELDHLLLPRTKGFVATVQGLREKSIKAVYDLTFVYSTPGQDASRVPSMGELVSRGDLQAEGYAFRVHVRRIPVEDLPEDEEGVGRWLRDAWVGKDRLIAEWRKRDKLEEGEEHGR